MIISWEQIRQVVGVFSEEHIMIKRFYSDYEDQLSTYATLGEDFPVLYMTPVDGNMGYTQNSLNIRFYCFDRIIRDRSNWNGIVSDTHRCLNDLYKFLQSPKVELIDTELEASITPINDAFMDYVAGWYMDVDISLDTYSDCFIMVDDVPTFNWSGTFGLKKICSELIDCPTIQDIQSDIVNIENILSGLTPDNFYTTGATLSGTTIIFDRNDLLNAYSVDISSVLPNPTDYDELSELEDVQITGTTKGGSTLTYNTSTGFWEDKPITWTVELIDALTVDVYAPYNLSIDTIINVLNSPSITIQDDDMSYTLGNPISIGSKITITASSVGVINLIINKL